MRILAASTGGAGHLGPMLPFLRGAMRAGHDVLLAAPESVRTSDVPFTALPDTPPQVLGAVYGSLEGLPRDEANARVMQGVFATANVDATLPALEALVARREPDLVIREVAELGSYVAATRAGVPHVQVAIGLRSFERFLVASAADGFLARYGADLAPLLETRALSLVPPSMEPPHATRERYRDPGMTAADGALPDELPVDDRPLVYVTFGSVTAVLPQYAGLYRAALDALAGVPARVLMTVGSAGDVDALGPLPANATVLRWAPQAAILRTAAVAVGHGGFGTTFGALASGVPVVVLPLFSYDQHENAEAVAESGAGVRVTAPEQLGDAVTHLLGDDSTRVVARRTAAEIAALPDAAAWVAASP